MISLAELGCPQTGFLGGKGFFCFSGGLDGVRKMECGPTIVMSLSHKQMSMFCLR